MKIEKGKLYLDTESKTLFKADFDSDNYVGFASDKIAVHCPTKYDWDYVNDCMCWHWDYFSEFPYRFLDNENKRGSLSISEEENYHIITIEEFKKFYPPNKEQDPYVWGDKIVISNKKDDIVQNVIQKYQQRSDVGIQKYGTTLQENNDGIEIFLTHLQEELMDATLYIEKLKNKFAQLKKEL